MESRSGIGRVEYGILEALYSVGALPDRGYRKSDRVLARVEERTGLAPDYAYRVLVDQVTPWTMPVNLVSGRGNFGGRGEDPPANPPYTECRMSRAGLVALSAERGEIAPVPIGLINGNTYGGGTRPPYKPAAIVAAIREVVEHQRVPDAEILEIVGPPDFVTDCTVHGDLAALAAGKQTELRLQGRIRISDDGGSVVITDLPPNSSSWETYTGISSRGLKHHWTGDHPALQKAVELPVSSVRDDSADDIRIVCVPKPGTTAEELRDQLAHVYGVYTTMRVALPKPLPAMIRNWVKINMAEDVTGSLTMLANALELR
jgi:DNA gyrase/topoisomerase IV subunit A